MRTVVLRIPDHSHVSTAIEHAQKEYHAIAFEVHQRNDCDDLIPLTDIMDYYNGSFQHHENITQLMESGYALVPWEDMTHDQHCDFADLVDLYSEGPTYMSADLSHNETLEEFTKTHDDWLINPEKPT